jgi:hypothetical protein
VAAHRPAAFPEYIHAGIDNPLSERFCETAICAQKKEILRETNADAS